MISCLLIHVSRNPQGVPVRQDSAVVGETIQIGRGAACHIHLSDHRVSLLHAGINRADAGGLYIEGAGEAILKINGSVAQRAQLLPGTQIEIGPYLLLVETASAGHDLSISVEYVHPSPASGAVTAVTIAAPELSKRKFGLLLAAGILLFPKPQNPT